MFTEAQTDITCAAARYRPETVAALDEFFAGLIGQKKIQAAGYLLARGGKIFAHKYAGQLRFDQPDSRFEPGSLRKIASITKVFTSIAVMQLVEDGLLYLEQPVADVIPEFDTPLHREINIRHLLTHSAGLKADPGYFLEPYPVWSELKTMDDIIRFALEGPLQSKPGAAWSYSTIGFVLLGEIIRRKTGVPYMEYVERKIIGPLGMENTHFRIPEEKTGRVCFTREDEIRQFENMQNGRTVYVGGSGLSSTPYDQFKIAQMFLNKGTFGGVRILGRRTVEAMTRDQFNKNTIAFCWGMNLKPMEYGAGVSISLGGILSRFVINHEGYGRCTMFADPSEDFVAVFMVPTASQWLSEIIENPRYIIWSGLE
jgi:CubicO group peptidase (beta-lactamase class C family)